MVAIAKVIILFLAIYYLYHQAIGASPVLILEADISSVK
jgi:hypothetical protein